MYAARVNTCYDIYLHKKDQYIELKLMQTVRTNSCSKNLRTYQKTDEHKKKKRTQQEVMVRCRGFGQCRCFFVCISVRMMPGFQTQQVLQRSCCSCCMSELRIFFNSSAPPAARVCSCASSCFSCFFTFSSCCWCRINFVFCLQELPHRHFKTNCSCL